MERVLEDSTGCTACSACLNICKKGAISLLADEEGFLYPVINKDVCVDCGLCKRVCPSLNVARDKDEKGASRDDAFPQEYYAAISNDEPTRLRSSSGGVFGLIADAFISKGAIVVGAYMDQSFVVRHGTSLDTDYKAFAGSKYVQSDMGDIFSKIGLYLTKGQTVLFSATPCQVAGLKSYLKHQSVDMDRLYTADFICHGVSSPKLWQDYCNYLASKHGPLEEYVFRGKARGWHGWYPRIICGGKDVSLEHKSKDSYILLYQSLNITRPSCFNCPYTSYDRVSDLTMADFWNIKNLSKDMDDDNGTSELLINSPKGKELFSLVKIHARVLECTKKDVWQPHLEYPNNYPRNRQAFWDYYKRVDMDKIMSRYGKGDAMTRLKNTITPILKVTGLYVLFGKLYRLLFVRK